VPRLRGGLGAAVILLTGALLAACGNSAASTAKSPAHSIGAQESPSIIEEPSWPPEAGDRTAAGASAAIRHWFDDLTYAYRVSDTKPLLAASTKSCKSCQALSSSLAATFSFGGDVRGGSYAVRSVSTTEFSSATPVLTVVFDRRAMTVVVAGGATVQSIPAVSFGSARVLMSYEHGRWQVVDVSGLGDVALTTDVAPSPGWVSPK
jgi:hypothetical protein